MDTNLGSQDHTETTQRQRGIVQFIRRNIVAIIVILGLVAGYFVLRTAPSDVGSMAELETMMAGGQPVLLEFYSNT